MATPPTIESMSKAHFDREHAHVQRAIDLHNQLQDTDAKIQGLKMENDKLLRANIRQMGEMKIAEGQAKIASGQAKIAHAGHGMLVNALAKMILAVAEKMPREANVTPAIKAKSIVEPILNKYEQQKTPDLTVFVEASKCMKLTNGIALVISEILAKVACTAPDLTKFQNQIDPQALRKVLSDAKITRVILHTSAKGTPAEQVTLESRKTIAFA